jgi:hypothetical protein
MHHGPSLRPARTRKNPVDAAGAEAVVDFLAGQLTGSPRWIAVWHQAANAAARADVRKVLGIVPSAPSQIVVYAMLQFASAWQSGDQPAAMQALAILVFTQPPQTLQALCHDERFTRDER